MTVCLDNRGHCQLFLDVFCFLCHLMLAARQGNKAKIMMMYPARDLCVMRAMQETSPDIQDIRGPAAAGGGHGHRPEIYLGRPEE